jgi:hypothetical protein
MKKAIEACPEYTIRVSRINPDDTGGLTKEKAIDQSRFLEAPT